MPFKSAVYLTTRAAACICQGAHQLCTGARSTNPRLICAQQSTSPPSGQSVPLWAFPEYRQHFSHVVRSNLRKQPPSTATNLITHIFFDVLWFHGFVGIICRVKCAKYKPGKNKQTINGLNWFPVTGKDFFPPSVLNVVFTLVKSVRIWFKLECTKYSTGVILHHWIQSSYCQWLEWRAEIQADFHFAMFSKAVPYELHTKQNDQTKQKRPPPHVQKEIKSLILKQSTATPGIWDYCFQRKNYLSKIPSPFIQTLKSWQMIKQDPGSSGARGWVPYPTLNLV